MLFNKLSVFTNTLKQKQDKTNKIDIIRYLYDNNLIKIISCMFNT